MCIIIASRNGRIPERHLGTALRANPDGWGFAVATGHSIDIETGLHTRDFWHEWDRRPRGPVLFHARIRTHGSVSVDNCHPFRVQPGLVMAHNGIITHVKKDKTLSDTRVFIRDILQQLPSNWIDNAAIRRMIVSFIGGSKLVFMNRRGIKWIANRGWGHEQGDRWYSNFSYLPVKVTKPVVAEPTYKLDEFSGLDETDRRLPEYYRNLTQGFTRTNGHQTETTSHS